MQRSRMLANIFILLVFSTVVSSLPFAGYFHSNQNANHNIVDNADQLFGDPVAESDGHSKSQVGILIAERIESITQKLAQLSDNSHILNDYVKDLHISDLIKEEEQVNEPQVTTSRPRFKAPAGNLGLLAALDSGPTNPHIFHAKKEVDPDTFKNENLGQFALLPRQNQDLIKEVAKEVIYLEENGDNLTSDSRGLAEIPSSKVEKRIEKLLLGGIRALDLFYQTPEFILNNPVLGDKLIEFRRKGAPIYYTIQVLRHAYILYKFRKTNPKDLSKSERDSVVHSKKVISDKTGEALSIVAHKLLKKINADKLISQRNVEEVMSRLFSTILERVYTDHMMNKTSTHSE